MARGGGQREHLGAVRGAVLRKDYAAAHRALSRRGDPRDLEPEALSLLADAAWWLGRVSEYIEVTEALHRRYLEAGEVDRAALHALDLAATWMLRGEHAVASGWFSRARRLLTDRPPTRAHGLLTYVEGCGALEEQRLDDAETSARVLQSLGGELADETLTALGLLLEGLAAIRRGELARGFGIVDEAMLPVLADRVDRELAGNIYCAVMAVSHDLMDLDRAREWTRVTERWVAGFSDAVMFLGVCRTHRLQLLVIEGAWGEAEREAAAVERDLAELNLAAVAEAAYQLGEAHRIRGQADRAAESYRLAAAWGRDPQPGAALLQLATGDAEAAWAAVTAAVAAAVASPFRCARLLRAQVEVAVAADRVGTAATAAERLAELRDRFPTPGFTAWADEARGAVLLAEGRAADAVPLLAAASGLLTRLGATYDAARTTLLLSSALGDAGDVDAAAVHERAALDALDRLGVPRPATVRPTGGPVPGGLTHREAEVLACVSTGASNREVAATLVVSEATVRRHLANIYLKLGVGSRTAAAAWAHEHGLVPFRG